MSTVYQGFDTKLQRPVAIKVLADAVAHQPDCVARFHQEARLLAGLRHPHIVLIYDYGEDQGAVYMVQELLPGPTLEQRIAELKQRDAMLSRDEIIAVARQIGSALDAAHAAGIIHRDVKPSNILWNTSGDLVLADFGVAKVLEEERLTKTGIVLGTPIYLSPEQAQGWPLGSSSDIYSFGVVLYELIAGHPPFEDATSLGVALSHVQKSPPSLCRSRPDLPSDVEAVVLRALAKRPAARFRSAGELAKALERAWPNTLSPYTSATHSMLPSMRTGGALMQRLRISTHMLPILAIFLALFIGATGWRTLHQPLDLADAAPSTPTFAVLYPTGIPTSAVIAAPQAPPAPAELATSVPIAQPDAPVAIPVAAPVPASSANQAPAQPPVPAAPVSPAGNHTDVPPKPETPKPPKSAPSKPSTPKSEQPKPPKPDKPDKPKPDKPSDKGKGGGKGK
jgi:serine/threonine-protein kinase